MRRARVCLAALALVSACAPEACSDREEQRVQRWVELLAGDPGPVADAAERALIEHGAASIQYLETGLYDADAPARRRIVKALVAIGDPAARPLLDHLARRDPDPGVRAAASEGQRTLGATGADRAGESARSP